MKKILLLNPRLPSRKKAFNIPMGCLCVGSYVHRHGFEVDILDENNAPGKEQFFRRVKESLQNSFCVGLSVMSAQIPASFAIARFIRNIAPGIPIIWGGTHPTLYPEMTVQSQFADAVVRGEGEASFLELLNAIYENKDLTLIPGIALYDKKSKKAIITGDRPHIDIDSLPPVNWNLLKDSRYLKSPCDIEKETELGIFLQTSRGCPHRCVFCINSVLNERYRTRRTDLVIEDIQSLVEKGAKRIFFIDEMFFMQKKRVEEICTGIINRHLYFGWYANLRADFIRKTAIAEGFFHKIKEAGCTIVGVGAESGSQRILDLLYKDIKTDDIITTAEYLRSAGISGHFSFMIGIPEETQDDVRKTVRLILRLCKNNPQIRILGPQVYRPYPGSILYQKCLSMGMKEPKTLSQWAKSPYIKGDLHQKQLAYFPWIGIFAAKPA